MPLPGTQYPIRDGTVYIFKSVHHRFNKKLGAACNHWRVIWIMRVFKRRTKHGRGQDTKVRCFRMDIPVLVGQHHRALYREGIVALRTLTKALKANNFEILNTKCLWEDRERDSKTFYRIVEDRLTISLI